MHYVKLFNINGVDTKQVACIELQGAPNAATEGAVGVLGMDMTSPTHEVYRCVAVNGSVYTWELLSAGMSILNATITGEGGLTHSFPYDSLRIPANYLIKRGDLIIDSDGYLYQVDSIGTNACDAKYCGTHIGGIASGDKDCSLVVKDGQLQLVTESGKVLGEVDFMTPDENTLYRDPSNGQAYVMGIRTVNDEVLHIFVGTKAEYDALSEIDKQNLFAIITDDSTRSDLQDGTFVVGKARYLEVGAPVLNVGKKLTEGDGYYTMYLVENTGANFAYSIGTFYWKEGMETYLPSPVIWFDGVAESWSLFVSIEANGSIKITNQSVIGIATLEDYTNNYLIYTKKVGE